MLLISDCSWKTRYMKDTVGEGTVSKMGLVRFKPGLIMKPKENARLQNNFEGDGKW